MRKYRPAEAKFKIEEAGKVIREAEWVIRDAVEVVNAWMDYCDSKDFEELRGPLANLAGSVRRFVDGDDR